MLTMMRDGGWSMWFVLLFGGGSLATAVMFLLRPERRALGRLKGLCVTTAAAALTGVAADLATVCHRIPQDLADDPKWPFYTLQGISESLAPAVMGFSLIALAALVGAVAVGRLPPNPA